MKQDLKSRMSAWKQKRSRRKWAIQLVLSVLFTQLFPPSNLTVCVGIEGWSALCSVKMLRLVHTAM